MIYHEIHKLAREGHSISYISERLILDRRTVSHYRRMSEVEFDRSIGTAVRAEAWSEGLRGLR